MEFWAKGERGGERFEIVLWSDRSGEFPGRPAIAERTLSDRWERHRIPVLDFSSKTVDISKLSRLAFGFNDAMSRDGTIFIDQVSFVDGEGNPVDISLDEPTSVTNIGLYMSSRVGAVNTRIESYDSALSKLGNTLTSLERMEKWRGFPQTHNHVVSLKPDNGDRCISFVDTGYLAAGLILARQRFPELASRVNAMLDAMDWNWFYDDSKGLPYGCRFPDGSASTWHYNLYGADSLLAHFIAIGSGKFPPATWNNLDRSKVAPQCGAKGFLAPGWQGGGVFMQFLPGIFIDEEGTPLRDSACAFVDDQICFSRRIGAPAWGWSATATPPLGCDYCGFGCVRNEFVVPHASILAIDCIKRRNLVENLVAFEQLGARQSASDGGASYDFGFRASINWQNGEVATPYLVLDQSMAFLSLCNDLNANVVRKLFCQDPISRSARDRIPEFASRCVN
ncbi:MAG TPA: hypothetical protein VJ810_40195 [Blastocatellia bacterium]|nr:hypothetical protein [Blastocatellia bacterium]